MTVKKNRFERWLQSIQDTQQEEISCSECFDLSSAYAELELAGNDAAVTYPQLRQHLDQCATCREEYETLRDFLRLEQRDKPGSPDDLLDSLP